MYKSIKNLTLISFCFAIILSLTNFNVLNAQENKNHTQNQKPNITKCKIQCDVQNFYDKDMIENKLKDEKGITDVYLDLEKKVIYVDYDKTIISSEKICKIVKDLGFEAKVVEEKENNLGSNTTN